MATDDTFVLDNIAAGVREGNASPRDESIRHLLIQLRDWRRRRENVSDTRCGVLRDQFEPQPPISSVSARPSARSLMQQLRHHQPPALEDLEGLVSVEAANANRRWNSEPTPAGRGLKRSNPGNASFENIALFSSELKEYPRDVSTVKLFGVHIAPGQPQSPNLIPALHGGGPAVPSNTTARTGATMTPTSASDLKLAQVFRALMEQHYKEAQAAAEEQRNTAKAKKITEEVSRKRFRCLICNRSFTSGQALGGHSRMHSMQQRALDESEEGKKSSNVLIVGAQTP